MANYKAKVEFTSKAGSFKPGDEFNTNKEHGEFLVNMKYAEYVSENGSSLNIVKEEVKEFPAVPLGDDETDEGHK